jgi:hypothetical protein
LLTFCVNGVIVLGVIKIEFYVFMQVGATTIKLNVRLSDSNESSTSSPQSSVI